MYNYLLFIAYQLSRPTLLFFCNRINRTTITPTSPRLNTKRCPRRKNHQVSQTLSGKPLSFSATVDGCRRTPADFEGKRQLKEDAQKKPLLGQNRRFRPKKRACFFQTRTKGLDPSTFGSSVVPKATVSNDTAKTCKLSTIHFSSPTVSFYH